MRVCTQMRTGDTKISMTERASPELQGVSGVGMWLQLRPGNPHSTKRACPGFLIECFIQCKLQQFLELKHPSQQGF